MWFKEAVSRAKLFHHIDITKAGIDKTKLLPPFNPSQTLKSTEDIQPLLPYLGKSFLELIPAEPYSNRASTNEARKYRQPRLLLKWDLDLDWAGEVHTEIDVAGTKISAQGAEGLRTVFAELRRRKGLERAVAEVLELCTGDVNRSSKKRKGE